MTSTFDSTGLVVDRYADIVERYIELAKEQWGESFNTEADGVWGHLIRNIALLQSETNEAVQAIYDASSVSNSTGAFLDDLVELIGLTRSAAAYSTVTLKLTATDATTVPAGSRYATSSDVIFATDSALVFTGAGTDTVAATCTITGPYDAAAGEVTVIKTPVYGISACTNDAAAIPGRDRQTDAELKTAHTNAVATSGDNDEASIYEALVAVTGVSAVYIFDNDTTSTAADGTPSGHIHVVVIGGSDDDVGTAINNNKTSGVGTYGSESVDVFNSSTGQTKTINFDRATNVPIHIEVSISKQTGVYPDDGDDQIKTNLLAHFDDLGIGDDVTYTALYRPIYDVAGLTVSALKVDTSDPPTGTSDVTISAVQRATLDTANIDIVEV